MARMKESVIKYMPKDLVKLVGEGEFVHWNDKKLRAVHVAAFIDMFVTRYYMFGKRRLSLSSELMRANYGTHYNHYLEYLTAHGVISLHSNYLVGEKSKTYELARVWCDQEDIVELQVLQKVKAPKKRKSHNESPVEEYIRIKMADDLKLVSLDPACLDWLESQRGTMSHRSYLKNRMACRKLLDNDLHNVFDRYGRYHTNVTVLKGDIRKRFLRLDGQLLLEIDITNSQPFFLYLEMLRIGHELWDGFDSDVLDEKIYYRLQLEGKFNSRKHAKEAMYKVMFGRNGKDHENKVFKRLYPNVWACIDRMKKEGGSHKVVSHQMQRMESNFIYNTVVARVMAEMPDARLLTVHDSVLCSIEHFEQIKTIFEVGQFELVSKYLTINKRNKTCLV